MEPAAEVEAFRLIYNTSRAHEALDFETPLRRYLEAPIDDVGPHLSEPASVQST